MGKRNKNVLSASQRIMLEHGAKMIVALQKGQEVTKKPRHIHRYKLIRVTAALRNGRAVKDKFYECQNPGCNQRDRMEIENA
jgi:hypothetical protein